MGFLDNDFLEKIYSNPATIVGDYELKLYGDEGFTITNLKTQKESNPIAGEFLYVIANNFLKILHRNNRDNRNKTYYDCSDDFDAYYYRIEVENNLVTLSYHESFSKGNNEWTSDEIITTSLEVAENLYLSALSMIEELEKWKYAYTRW